MAINLTERDESVFEVMRRHRVISRRLALTLFGGSESALQKWVKRMGKYIESESPGAGFTYYRFTPGGTRLVGVPEEAARPPQRLALESAIGIQTFCFNTDPPRWRYTRPDFTADFAELVSELNVERDYFLPFYLDQADAVRLGEMIVDHGGDYQKLLQKVYGRVRRYVRTSPVLREIIENDLYCIALLVPNQTKRAAIENGINSRPPKISVRVEVCEQMGELFAGK